MNSNFDIELYIQETDPDTMEEKLVPLYFPYKQSPIQNNILIGDGSVSLDLNNTNDPKYAEYFLDIRVDDEISPEVKNTLPEVKQSNLQIITSNNNSIKTSK